MQIALINSPSLSDRPISRSMAGGLGFDGSEAMILPPLDLAIMAAAPSGDSSNIFSAGSLGITSTWPSASRC